MELVTFKLPRTVADHSPVYIAPIGDIQYSGKHGPTAKDHLKRHLDKCQALGAWYIGLGDFCDFLSPSNRQRLKAAALYDTADDVIDEKAMDLVYELYEEFLKPTKGRWLGYVAGHHFHHLKSGDTTDMRLCAMLDCKFLGTSAFLRVQFTIGHTRGNVVLFVHHGVGSGLTAGAPITRLERLAMGWEGADVFLIGHSTKMPATRIQRPYPRWHGQNAPDLVHRDILLVSTGSFSKGHVVGAKQGQIPTGTYVEQKMLNPSALGAPILKITPRMRFHDRSQREPGTGKKIPGTRVEERLWSPELTVEL